MPNFSHYPFQTAIYNKLTGDSALMSSIAGVFDHTPEAQAYPYVTLGESSISDWSSKTTEGTEHNFTLHIWSREGGRKQAAQIMERIHTLLHQGNLTITGQSLVLMRFVSSNIVLENDGWTHHGVMRFRALLQAN